MARRIVDACHGTTSWARAPVRGPAGPLLRKDGRPATDVAETAGTGPDIVLQAA